MTGLNWRQDFVRAVIATALWSASLSGLLGVVPAHGTPNTAIPAGMSGFAAQGLPTSRAADSNAPEFTDHAARLSKEPAALRNEQTAGHAMAPLPAGPSEYLLLAAGFLILWGVLSWKHRARRTWDSRRRRPKS